MADAAESGRRCPQDAVKNPSHKRLIFGENPPDERREVGHAENIL